MKKFLFMMLAIPMVFAACSKDEAEPQPQPTPDPTPKPTLTLTSEAEMSFEANGGNGIITYTLTNPTEGVKLTATCEAEWITNLTAGDNVVFVVAANEGEARETTITVAYDTLSFDVTVKQAAKAEEPEDKTPKFTLTSEEVMEFGQNEAMGTITFELKNPIQGVNVTAKANVSWISQVTPQADKIIFAVAANTGDAREGKITAKYGELSFEVTIKQAEYVAPAPEIYIDSADEQFQTEGGDGEIAFRVVNTIEGVEATATSDVEWITINSVANGIVSYTVAANDTDGMRSGAITLAYGEVTATVTIEQLFDNYDPNMNYSTFVVTEAWADLKNAGKQWNVIFVEHDTILGDIQTVISFGLQEANVQRLVDGTYSVANGGILVNSAVANGFSSYRSSSSQATDITDATFEVSVDTESQKITIAGTFQAANNIVTLRYYGEMRGMDLSEAVEETPHFTEWGSVVKKYQDSGELLFEATSADGRLVLLLDIYHTKDSSKICPEGKYEVADYQVMENFVANGGTITLNSVKGYLKSGWVECKHISGGYEFTFDLVDEFDRNVTGVISGAVSGGVNPE